MSRGLRFAWPTPRPFPYGTILRPVAGKTNYPTVSRLMVVGPRAAAYEQSTMLIRLDTEKPEAVAYLNEALVDEWEEDD